ncbi:hypothetical protein [Pseudorhodobacter ferrugineus]|uniref:hypothetical protein n=1 Tax=Pseudorhodobacter ferrugineus TaxID=77008 RepID=UPI0003B30134|nr:hypothetical protein [Pseudorhodobacter ferrugineus]
MPSPVLTADGQHAMRLEQGREGLCMVNLAAAIDRLTIAPDRHRRAVDFNPPGDVAALMRFKR